MTPQQRERAEVIRHASGNPLVCLLESGEYASLQRMFYTTGLMVGRDETGYRTRFCYPDDASALEALLSWDGRGDPPGPWLKEKGRRERWNPLRYLRGIPVRVEYTKEKGREV